MTIRRLLAAAVIAAAALTTSAPAAGADTACAWVDPYGVCISNPLPAVFDIVF